MGTGRTCRGDRTTMKKPALQRRDLVRAGAAAGLGWALPARSGPAEYPERPVRIIVPYAPGGPADTYARLAARQLSALWHQSVVVDNRAGATGIIGTDLVAKAPADGLTLLVGSGSTAIGVTLEDKLPYDTLKDLQPICGLAFTPYFLFAHPGLAARNVQELVTLARSRPEQIRFGSAGAGGVPHLAGEMFNLLAQTRLLHVPYKGTGPATTAMVGDEVQLMFGSLTSTHGFLKNQRLKVLASADARRSPLMPEVPTIAESGVPGFEAENWFGLFAPAATPSDVAESISEGVARGMATSEARGQLATLGALPMKMAGRDFVAYFRRQVEIWGRVIRARGIRKE